MTVAAIVLAAGRSTRMQGIHKLVATIGGRPLVRIAVEAALASRAHPVIVVTGHRSREVREALAELPVIFAQNQDSSSGLSASLRAGLASLPPDITGAVVLLADMPGIDAALIDRLLAAFEREGDAPIVVATHEGLRGNPVLWPRRFFPRLMMLRGDVGGRELLEAHREAVVFVDLGPAAATDVDTPEALAAARGKPHPPGQ